MYKFMVRLSMKVGIISLYYKNHNYGGLLQAYALTSYLNKHGIDAEQMSWDFLDGLKKGKKRTHHYRSIGIIVKRCIIFLIEWANKRNQNKRKQVSQSGIHQSENRSFIHHPQPLFSNSC